MFNSEHVENVDHFVRFGANAVPEKQ
jgi:hypothetical protein